MMAQCRATKRDGTRCTLQVEASSELCWAHDPANAEQRRKRSSRGGRSKASKAVKALHGLLEDLTRQVIDGELETSRGAVANQLITTRIKLFEYERRLRETQELETRLEELETLLETRKGQRGWGA